MDVSYTTTVTEEYTVEVPREIDVTTTVGGDDLLFGGEGDDFIAGEDGEDWIVGGKGKDDLWGNSDLAVDTDPATYDGDAAKDVFFHGAGDGDDIIHDFEAGVDQIVISGDYSNGSVSFADSNGDVVITLDDGAGGLDTETITLSGVSTGDLFGDPSSDPVYSGADNGEGADTANDGTLGADELIDLREDLFNDTPNAPDAGIQSVIVVAPMDASIINLGTDESDVS